MLLDAFADARVLPAPAAPPPRRRAALHPHPMLHAAAAPPLSTQARADAAEAWTAGGVLAPAG